MCLILLAWRQHPDFPLVVAANRDEFHARPTAPLARWEAAPQVIAGRDLQAGGTWLGVTDGGRFAAVTNVREPGAPAGRRSRGDLTRRFLLGDDSPQDFMSRIAPRDYAGFNLLAGDRESLWYFSNRGGDPSPLPPGVAGLSNHRLETPWPKLVSAKARFTAALSTLPAGEAFFQGLADDETAPDAALPATGVPLPWERLLSAVFVRSPTYGTRASTLLLVSAAGGLRIEERSFGPGDAPGRPAQSSVISTGV